MKWYKPGATIPDYDDRVTQALDGIEPFDGGRMVFGIRNVEGEIYRIFRMDCLGEVFRASNQLYDAGFADELKDSMLPNAQGFDSVWSPAKAKA